MRKSLSFSFAFVLAAAGCGFYPRDINDANQGQGYQQGALSSPCAFPQTPRSCTLDLDCAGYQICIQGGCQLACAGQGDCYFDQTCNPNGGFCVCNGAADGGATSTGTSSTGSSATGTSTGSATGSSTGSSTGGATTTGSSTGGASATGGSTAGSGTGGGTT